MKSTSVGSLNSQPWPEVRGASTCRTVSWGTCTREAQHPLTLTLQLA